MKHSVEKIVLSNGAKGLFIDVPGAQVMNFDFELRAGHYQVERAKWEVPHIMEHMAFGANERYADPQEFNAEFEKNGAYFNASTDTTSIHYIAECADFEWDRIAELILLSVSKPFFTEEIFQAEFGNVRDELYARNNNEFRRLSLNQSQEVGLNVIDDITRVELMKNVSNQDVIDFYKKTHTAKNIRFIIAGAIKGREDRLKSILEAGIDLPAGERFELPKENPKKLQKPFVMHDEAIPNMYFFIDTFADKRLTSEQKNALSVLDIMLTGTLHSLILGTARTKGLVYSMGSGPMHYANRSSWYLGAQVTLDKAEALFEIIRTQLSNVLAGDFTDADVQAAVQLKRGALQLHTQTVGKLADHYHHEYYFDESIDGYTEFNDALKDVTKSDIVAVAQELFSGDCWSLGTLGNCSEELAEKLRSEIAELWS